MCLKVLSGKGWRVFSFFVGFSFVCLFVCFKNDKLKGLLALKSATEEVTEGYSKIVDEVKRQIRESWHLKYMPQK